MFWKKGMQKICFHHIRSMNGMVNVYRNSYNLSLETIKINIKNIFVLKDKKNVEFSVYFIMLRGKIKC